MAKAARELGADAALVVTPYYNKPTARGILAHYRHIAEQSPLPIVLYHVPGRTNVTMSAETITELLKHPNIVGIKEASANQTLWLSLSRTCDLSQKSLLAGDDDAFVTVKSMGGSGIISATANVIPDLFVKMHELTENGQWAAAWDLQRKALPIIQAMFVETNPTPVKYALKLLRGYENTVRLPLVTVTEESERKIASSLKEAGYL
jgi:4-hydroxy-tetrahydrodipicolinate synthase